MYNHDMHILRELITPQGVAIRLAQGDITQSSAEAIVNAANPQLQHGGGVAGAIARAGGSAIRAESEAWIREHGLVTHDSPAITTGGELDCRYVIHAVGPIWGEGDEQSKLAAAVKSALLLADQYTIQTIALPAISTGVYGFPKDQGARVILDALLRYFEEFPDSSLRQIDITLLDDSSVTTFATEFEKRWGSGS